LPPIFQPVKKGGKKKIPGAAGFSQTKKQFPNLKKAPEP